ncbi:TnsA-like heteromeric transposase endonuclease subunit [Dietzia sp. 179-F 9C3 NHS]|uniref:TnsA-like heteromeric transposase endonuclease subunit n=1 Tax=Dietzia sp. 179-F 9C3 NHS TaxID=3374295 RepID=UPI003879E0EF
MTKVTWSFRWEGIQGAQEWREGLGPTDFRCLRPFRAVRASARSRNIAARPWSHTIGGVLDVESGLEHDLVRKLDRDPRVNWLTPQPCQISWEASTGRRSHVPDLLSVDTDGQVTIWDVRPVEKQDEDFLNAMPVTREACSALGWSYTVFSELSRVERLNLLWLGGFRRPPSWIEAVRPLLIEEVRLRGTVKLGELMRLDRGDGLVKAGIWHLIWSGQLECDLTSRINLNSEIRTSVGAQ